MLKQCEPADREVDLLFQALSDPTRRLMVDRLSGLVRSEKVGRVRTCNIQPAAMQTAEQWISERRTFWEQNLDRLGEYLAEHPDPADRPDRPYQPEQRSTQ